MIISYIRENLQYDLCTVQEALAFRKINFCRSAVYHTFVLESCFTGRLSLIAQLLVLDLLQISTLKYTYHKNLGNISSFSVPGFLYKVGNETVS